MNWSLRWNKLHDVKQNIRNKIRDIDQMLNDLSADENEMNVTKEETLIDINELDVVDVLHKILN